MSRDVCPTLPSGRHVWWRLNGVYECVACAAPLPTATDDEADETPDDES
ncbi:hypothetical protein [Pseudofrankia sp. DC12]|nr:hypothetical protein [Pseudofrankia sp. DC12]